MSFFKKLHVQYLNNLLFTLYTVTPWTYIYIYICTHVNVYKINNTLCQMYNIKFLKLIQLIVVGLLYNTMTVLILVLSCTM